MKSAVQHNEVNIWHLSLYKLTYNQGSRFMTSDTTDEINFAVPAACCWLSLFWLMKQKQMEIKFNKTLQQYQLFLPALYLAEAILID